MKSLHKRPGLYNANVTTALACPDNYIGTTGALSLSSRFLGGSVGTAIYFNVFNTKLKQSLPLLVGEAAVKAGLSKKSVVPLVEAMAQANFQTLAPQVPGVTPQVLQATIYARQWAFAAALKYVWYTTIPFGIVSCLCCLALPNIKKYMTNRVAVVSLLYPSRCRGGSDRLSRTFTKLASPIPFESMLVWCK